MQPKKTSLENVLYLYQLAHKWKVLMSDMVSISLLQDLAKVKLPDPTISLTVILTQPEPRVSLTEINKTTTKGIPR